jgi:hypothetical protein
MKSKFTREQKEKLLRDVTTLDWLNASQIFKLWWWQYFKKRKIEVFYESLSIGKHAFAAYKDAEKA